MNLAFDDIFLDQGLGPWFKWFLAVSTVLHLVALYFGLFILPDLAYSRKPLDPVYTVNLVSLPPAGRPQAPENVVTTAPPEPKAPPKPVAAPPAAPPEREKAKLVPVGPIEPEKPEKPQVEKIKKPEPEAAAEAKIDIDKALEQRLAEVRRKVRSKEKGEDRIASAIAGLEKRVGAGTATGVAGSGRPGEGDRMSNEYLPVVVNIISASWIMPPESLIRSSSGIQSILVIRIDRTGRIAENWFERKSGEKLFDQSVEKAIQRAGTLPPLPEWFKGDSFEVGLVFTPAGIQR